MNHLAKLQHTFQHCVLDNEPKDTTEWISASGRATPDIQLSVYTHAYHARLTEVLATDYPAMLMAIGDDRFNQLAGDYINSHPSHFFSLREYGQKFPDFIGDLLEQQKHHQNSFWFDKPWLYELGLFEWTLAQAFDAADASLFSVQQMATIPAQAWPDLKFIIHPSVQRLNMQWNIPEMWLALTDNEPTHITAVRDTTSPWLIWREQLVTRFRSMQNDEQLALDCLREGKNFNQMCENLTIMMSDNEVPMRAASLLKGWISQGLISGINKNTH